MDINTIIQTFLLIRTSDSCNGDVFYLSFFNYNPKYQLTIEQSVLHQAGKQILSMSGVRSGYVDNCFQPWKCMLGTLIGCTAHWDISFQISQS